MIPPAPFLSPTVLPAFVAGTRRSWAIDVSAPITGPDLTTVTGAYLYVHRLPAGIGAVETVETWTVVIDTSGTPPHTALAVRVINTPTASGVGSVTVVGDVFTMRLMLQFGAGPEVECTRFRLPPVEAK